MKTERRKLDQYPTPAWQTRALAARIELKPTDIVLEPCVGAGAITDVLYPFVCDFITNDIDLQYRADTHMDAQTGAFWTIAPRGNWIITNPPFNASYWIVRRALEQTNANIAMLLRLSWLEPTENRGPLLAANPPTQLIVLPRWSYTGSGSDTMTTAWVVWEREPARINTAPVSVVTKEEMARLQQPQ